MVAEPPPQPPSPAARTHFASLRGATASALAGEGLLRICRHAGREGRHGVLRMTGRLRRIKWSGEQWSSFDARARSFQVPDFGRKVLAPPSGSRLRKRANISALLLPVGPSPSPAYRNIVSVKGPFLMLDIFFQCADIFRRQV